MASQSKSRELVVAGPESPLAVLQMEQSELQELIADNLQGENLSPGDLDRVKVPGGGGLTWEVPTVDGSEALKTIEGVIVYRATRRAYWKDKYSGADDAPQCSSNDGITGEGDPGGECAACPLNEFESGHDGIGKACKETRQLFLLTPDSLLPIIITIPPGSLKNAKAYFMRLMRSRLKTSDIITHIGLEKAQSKTGIAFSRVTLTAGDRLDPEASERLREYAAAIEPSLRAPVRVERDEVADG